MRWILFDAMQWSDAVPLRWRIAPVDDVLNRFVGIRHGGCYLNALRSLIGPYLGTVISATAGENNHHNGKEKCFHQIHDM